MSFKFIHQVLGLDSKGDSFRFLSRSDLPLIQKLVGIEFPLRESVVDDFIVSAITSSCGVPYDTVVQYLCESCLRLVQARPSADSESIESSLYLYLRMVLCSYQELGYALPHFMYPAEFIVRKIGEGSFPVLPMARVFGKVLARCSEQERMEFGAFLAAIYTFISLQLVAGRFGDITNASKSLGQPHVSFLLVLLGESEGSLGQFFAESALKTQACNYPSLPPTKAIRGMPLPKDHKNSLLLCHRTALGALLVPSTIDYIPRTIPGSGLGSPASTEPNVKQQYFSNFKTMTLQRLDAGEATLRNAIKESVISPACQVVNTMLRAGPNPKDCVISWIARVLRYNAPRSSLSWRNSHAMPAGNLAEYLFQVPRNPMGFRANGSLAAFRSILAQESEMMGLVGSGYGLNVAWMVFELCKPVKLETANSLDYTVGILGETDAQKDCQASLFSEARLGPKDTCAKYLSTLSADAIKSAGSFKNQAFWFGLSALNCMVVPACKEAESALGCASVMHRNKRPDECESDAFGEYYLAETVLKSPDFMHGLAHVMNLVMISFLSKVTGVSVPKGASLTQLILALAAKLPEVVDRSSDGIEGLGESDLLFFPACTFEDIIETIEFYHMIEMAQSGSRSQPVLGPLIGQLDKDVLLMFIIFMLGSESVRNPNIRGRAAKVLMSLRLDREFANRINGSPYCLESLIKSCVRVFTAVEKTHQSYYDIRMHVKFELRIPLQVLFEELLANTEHQKQMERFATERPDDLAKFMSHLLNDTTYLLDEGLDTLVAIRLRAEKDGEEGQRGDEGQRDGENERDDARDEDAGDSPGSNTTAEQGANPDGSGSAGAHPQNRPTNRGPSGGTAGLGVDRAMADDERNEHTGQDIYRRSRLDAAEHCKQYMKMGHQCMSTLYTMSKFCCGVVVKQSVVFEQMIVSCLNPCLDRLVGPKCLKLKASDKRNDFDQYEFNPKTLLFQLLSIYGRLSKFNKARLIKLVTEDGHNYKPETLRKACAIARRERLVDAATLKTFEEFAKEANESFSHGKNSMDSVEIPDEFLDPIMADLMTDPVLIPTSNKIMDRKHITRIILADDHDPFTRMPLRLDQLVPQTELRDRVRAFCAQNGIAIDE